LQKIKNSLSAGVQAQLREQEKENKLDFYKLKIKDSDLADIEVLNRIRPSLHTPEVLSKLIWTTYYQKQTTELCNRVFGTSVKCGI
jgi:hypothetical protein